MRLVNAHIISWEPYIWRSARVLWLRPDQRKRSNQIKWMSKEKKAIFVCFFLSVHFDLIVCCLSRFLNLMCAIRRSHDISEMKANSKKKQEERKRQKTPKNFFFRVLIGKKTGHTTHCRNVMSSPIDDSVRSLHLYRYICIYYFHETGFGVCGVRTLIHVLFYFIFIFFYFEVCIYS